jgi:2,3-dihydroxybiphenyl 1,2-dioxygenase
MDELPYRFFLEHNDRDDLSVAGWTFDTEGELEAFVADAREKGAAVTLQGKEAAQNRQVERLYSCPDPNGYTHEFSFGVERLPLTQAFRSKVLQSQFVTGDLGVGHILPLSRNADETIRFYREILKLRVSDYIRQETPNGVLDANFFHTRTGRHHSIATAQVSSPKILNHLMVQVAVMDDVGLAYDRCIQAGLHIAAELGHHPNDHMFSFYVQSPSGFNIEYGWGGLVIDDADWQVTCFTQQSDWGHKRNPQRA